MKDVYHLEPVGVIHSSLSDPATAPRQGDEGAPSAWLRIGVNWREALDGLEVGDDILVLTWLDRASRAVLQVRPRRDTMSSPTGVFATRSPDRPNPIGLHPVRILSREDGALLVGPIEAVDGTPVLDIKPVLPSASGR